MTKLKYKKGACKIEVIFTRKVFRGETERQVVKRFRKDLDAALQAEVIEGKFKIKKSVM